MFVLRKSEHDLEVEFSVESKLILTSSTITTQALYLILENLVITVSLSTYSTCCETEIFEIT